MKRKEGFKPETEQFFMQEEVDQIPFMEDSRLKKNRRGSQRSFPCWWFGLVYCFFLGTYQMVRKQVLVGSVEFFLRVLHPPTIFKVVPFFIYCAAYKTKTPQKYRSRKRGVTYLVRGRFEY